MASPHDSVSMALFCDFENVALGVRDAKYEKFDITPVLERLLLKGSIVVKKAYCDWDRYKGFKAAMHEASFELIEIPHVRHSGKNSADIRLVVDALDLCYTKSHVDTFVIISGDSDFSPLVSKLRENAKKVIGVGVKNSTSDLLVANCDEFIFIDDLVREQQRTQAKREAAASAAADNATRRQEGDRQQKPKQDSQEVEARKAKAFALAVETFDALSSERGDSNKIWASVLKDAIKRRRPDFNESYFGFRAFGSLLDEAQARGLFEVGRDEKSGTYVFRSTQEPARTGQRDVKEAEDTGADTNGTTDSIAIAASANIAAAPQATALNAPVAEGDRPAKKSRRRGGRDRDRERDRNGNGERVGSAGSIGNGSAGSDRDDELGGDRSNRQSAGDNVTVDAESLAPELPLHDGAAAFEPVTHVGAADSADAGNAHGHAAAQPDAMHYLDADRDAADLSIGTVDETAGRKRSPARRARRTAPKRAEAVVAQMLELDATTDLQLDAPNSPSAPASAASADVPAPGAAVETPAAAVAGDAASNAAASSESEPAAPAAKRARRPAASARRARKTAPLFPE